MNKQELIKKYGKKYSGVSMSFGAAVLLAEIQKDLKQLDEQKEKVTLPRPVANWISCVRGRNKTLHFALENAPEEVNLWFCEDEKNRQNIFADAWVNGYHIEREKRYLVKMKGLNSEYDILTYIERVNQWLFSERKSDPVYYRKTHTRKELEEAGFGEVFNSPLFEIEEVQE